MVLSKEEIKEIIEKGILAGTNVPDTIVTLEDDEFWYVHPHGMIIQQRLAKPTSVRSITEAGDWTVYGIVTQRGYCDQYGPLEPDYDEEVEIGEARSLCEAIGILAAEYARAEAVDTAGYLEQAIEFTKSDNDKFLSEILF